MIELGSYKLSERNPTPEFAKSQGWRVLNCLLDSPVDSRLTHELINKTIRFYDEEYIIKGVERYAVARPVYQIELYVVRLPLQDAKLVFLDFGVTPPKKLTNEEVNERSKNQTSG